MIHLNTSDITRERDDLRGVVQPADGSDDRTRDTARFQRALLGVNTLYGRLVEPVRNLTLDPPLGRHLLYQLAIHTALTRSATEPEWRRGVVQLWLVDAYNLAVTEATCTRRHQTKEEETNVPWGFADMLSITGLFLRFVATCFLYLYIVGLGVPCATALSFLAKLIHLKFWVLAAIGIIELSLLALAHSLDAVVCLLSCACSSLLTCAYVGFSLAWSPCSSLLACATWCAYNGLAPVQWVHGMMAASAYSLATLSHIVLCFVHDRAQHVVDAAPAVYARAIHRIVRRACRKRQRQRGTDPCSSARVAFVARDVVTMAHVRGAVMVADILTKACARPIFLELLRLLDNFAAAGESCLP
jgi:hypothetical protein